MTKRKIPNFHAIGCNCKTECRHYVEPMEKCVDYMSRDGSTVEVKYCRTCKAHVWHKTNKCIRHNTEIK